MRITITRGPHGHARWWAEAHQLLARGAAPVYFEQLALGRSVTLTLEAAHHLVEWARTLPDFESTTSRALDWYALPENP